MATDPPQPEQQFLAPILGSEAETLIELNQKLSQLGINNTIKLSSIVVIGDQSTGKSSLIERISDVKVPKASGLCTRCCIAINLSSGQAWKCSVWIEEPYLYNKSVKPSRVTKTRQMGPWELKPEPTTTFVGETYDRGNLIDLIEKAQNLVLNPNRNQQSGQESFNQRLELFSPNVIRLDISVGSCPNLSFVDMPGCISSLTGKDQPDYYVDLVSNLASTAARDENNIVLLVLPSNHDSSNSRSYGIIQKQKAQSHTMAVYTKVDVAREEELKDLLAKQFGEEEEEFEHGNHIVMLRDSAGSAADVNAAERDFFSQPPWDGLPQTTRNRLGVANLVDLLRQILFQKTAEALPSYVQHIRTRIMKVQSDLKDMPAPPDTTEIPSQLNLLIFRLEQNISQLFASSQGSTSVSSRSKLTELMVEFKEQIQSDAPTLTFRSELEQEQFDEAKKSIAKRNTAADYQEDASANTEASPSKRKSKTEEKDSQDSARGPYNFTLDQIMDLNKEHQSTCVPGDIEPKAVEAMHLLSVRPWNEQFQHHMLQVSEVVHSEVLQCIRTTFSGLKHLPIYKKVQQFARGYLEGITKNEQARLQHLCDAETRHPLCSDDVRLKAAEQEHYQEKLIKRNKDRLMVEKEVQKAKMLSSNKKKPKDLTVDDLASDPWDIELRMAAKTSAYYEVATVRFVDHVCQDIWAHLIPQIWNNENGLVDHIRCQLGLGLGKTTVASAQLLIWMIEDLDRENLRNKRQDELKRLQAGYNYISEVSKQLKQQGPSQIHGVYENTRRFESALSEDGFVTGGGSTSYVSPNKRRVTETDFDTNEQDQSQSPSKRVRSTPKIGQDQQRTRLPSRARSTATEEEMDEGDDESC